MFTKTRVLVVEDDEVTRSLLRRMLRALRFASVETAATAEAARLAFHADPSEWPDVVLCDIEMKPTNGHEFVRWMRAIPSPRAKAIRVVMVTSHADVANVRDAMAAGVSGYLVKPVTEAALRIRMERLLAPPT